eukprot:TRINITY_DN9243_c0_g1_i1.p1 TRINITY_DN9243_c0_g1~~TRINITY_DN9243_c0_g1_i1.p1  ORF type:complete len:453 (-),score=191.32 TRINITY_DN9243_c0_g1_i1:42-1400(-)
MSQPDEFDWESEYKKKPLPPIPKFAGKSSAAPSSADGEDATKRNQNGPLAPAKPPLLRSPSDISMLKDRQIDPSRNLGGKPQVKYGGFSYFSPPSSHLSHLIPPPSPPMIKASTNDNGSFLTSEMGEEMSETAYETVKEKMMRKSQSFGGALPPQLRVGEVPHPPSRPTPPKPPPKPFLSKDMKGNPTGTVTTISQALLKKEEEVESLVNDLRDTNTLSINASPRTMARREMADKEVEALLDLLKEVEGSKAESLKKHSSGTLNVRYQNTISDFLLSQSAVLEKEEEEEKKEVVIETSVVHDASEEEIQQRRKRLMNSRNTIYGGFESLVVKRGYLVKRGGKIKNWKGRYFVLEGNLLYYFKSPNSPHPTGVVPLIDVKVERADSNVKRKFSLEISAINNTKHGLKTCKFVGEDGGVGTKGNHSTFVLSAPNEGVANDWLKAIDSSIVISPQ